MASRTENWLFSWKGVDDLGDLKRLQLALDNLSDAALMRHFECESCASLIRCRE